MQTSHVALTNPNHSNQNICDEVYTLAIYATHIFACFGHHKVRAYSYSCAKSLLLLSHFKY